MSGFPASVRLVGCGNMGSAMLRRWIAAGLDPARVTVVDPYAREVPEGVTLLAEAPAETPEVIVLAVKPQQLDTILPASLPSSRRKPGSPDAGETAERRDSALPGEVTPAAGGPGFRRDDGPLLISILAGVEEAVLRERFRVSAVIRAMPNLPVGIGKGVVALHSGDADAGARALAEALMAPLGLVEWIAEERLFDAVTALSGSGPGFVYRIVEAFAAAGASLGLPADQAQRFATAMVEGAAALAASSPESPAQLAERVASPGGTTRAGLDVLDSDDALVRLIHQTLAAAARRSEELAAAARAG